MKSDRPRCIVCGKAIGKRLSHIWFREARGEISLGFGHVSPARLHGSRTSNGGMTELFLDHLPQTKEEAQRHSNHPIQRVISHRGFITQASFWDGESYRDPYFDKGACAIKQGYAAAAHGHRFTWE